MRLPLAAMVAGFLMTTAAVAQNSGGAPAPAVTGNRANGLNYQPTPSQVVPREKAAGIQPPVAQRKATDQLLEHTDRKLLQDEGQSTKSVPNLTAGQQRK